MKKSNNKICAICESTEWHELPEINPHKSLTTACVVVNEQLGKAQCKQCGLVQRTNVEFLGNTSYYEEQYDGYYSRPGANFSNRNKIISDWIINAITPFAPENIIDVGCGQGDALICLNEKLPNSDIWGLEPSFVNAKKAEDRGFKILRGKLNENIEVTNQFDLVISIYVLQHAVDPVDFFKGLKKILAKDGLAAVIIPKSEIPNIELIWSDQNYSYCAEHIVNLAQKAGLNFVALHDGPKSISPSWLIILSDDSANISKNIKEKGLAIPKIDFESLYRKKCHYLESYKRLDDFLCFKTKAFNRVINFGASDWASILAIYCPNYWEKVDFCVVDNTSGKILGKNVIPTEHANLTNEDMLVLGVQTSAQLKLFERFNNENINSIMWCNFIKF